MCPKSQKIRVNHKNTSKIRVFFLKYSYIRVNSYKYERLGHTAELWSCESRVQTAWYILVLRKRMKMNLSRIHLSLVPESPPGKVGNGLIGEGLVQDEAQGLSSLLSNLCNGHQGLQGSWLLVWQYNQPGQARSFITLSRRLLSGTEGDAFPLGFFQSLCSYAFLDFVFVKLQNKWWKRLIIEG